MNHDEVRDTAPAFVLGALEPAEEQAVRDHLATCGQPHPEFEAYGGVVQYFDETVELVEPPATLKVRVMAAVAAEPKPRPKRAASPKPADRPAAVSPVAAPETPSGRAQPAIVRLPPAEERAPTPSRRAGPGTWLLRIAAVLAIVGLAGWNVQLQMQLGQVPTQPGQASGYERAITAVLDIAARQGSQTAILSGAGGQGPRGIAAIAADGGLALAMRDLDPTTGSQVYEAWLIAPGGAPAPIGSFQVGADRTASFTTRAPATPGATIALTREPGPGATTPTLPIVSSGVATAPAS